MLYHFHILLLLVFQFCQIIFYKRNLHSTERYGISYGSQENQLFQAKSIHKRDD